MLLNIYEVFAFWTLTKIKQPSIVLHRVLTWSSAGSTKLADYVCVWYIAG